MAEIEIKKTPDGIEIPPPGPDDVLYEADGNVVRITLNRPTVLNAMNKNVQRLLNAALDRAEADDEVKVRFGATPCIRSDPVHNACR